MSTERCSQHHRHGALMRLAARHQNSTVVIRTTVNDTNDGVFPHIITPVYPTLCIRSGLGRSSKSVAKVNSSWNDNGDNHGSYDCPVEEDDRDSYNLSEMVSQTISTDYQADIRDEDDEKCYRELELFNSNKVSPDQQRLKNPQQTLFHMSGHNTTKSKNQTIVRMHQQNINQGHVIKDTTRTGTRSSFQRSKQPPQKKMNLFRTLSCRNATEVIDSEPKQAKKVDEKVSVTEDFQHQNKSNNGQDILLYKYYAGKTDTNEVDKTSEEMKELDALVSQVRHNLKNARKLDDDPCSSDKSYMNCTHSQSTRQRSSRKDKT